LETFPWVRALSFMRLFCFDIPYLRMRIERRRPTVAAVEGRVT
jgi:hypothetical protein